MVRSKKIDRYGRGFGKTHVRRFFDGRALVSHREFSIAFQGDIYARYQCYRNADEFAAATAVAF